MKKIISVLMLLLSVSISSVAQQNIRITKLVTNEEVKVSRGKDNTIVILKHKFNSDNSIYRIGATENRIFMEDVKTGKHYQMRGVVGYKNCVHKTGITKTEHIFTGYKGETAEIEIEFPRLPKSVKEVRFWHLADWLTYSEKVFSVNSHPDEIKYDRTIPKFPKLTVIKDASQYNKEDKYSFPIFGDENAVAPLVSGKDKNIAMWCTKECTIIAEVHRLTWDMHYYQRKSGDYIQDSKTLKIYRPVEGYDGLPVDTSYNIKGVSGEWVCFMRKYPPLPKECASINLISENVTDKVKNGASWGGEPNRYNVSIESLQKNQHIVKFRKTKIYK